MADKISVTSRADSTFAAAAEVVDVDAGAESAGTSDTQARGDHKHHVVVGVAPGASAPGDAAAEGSNNALARADHRHGRESFGGSGDVQAVSATGSNNAGASALVPRADHQHNVTTGISPSTSAVGDASSQGVAAGLARGDHRHGREGFGSVNDHILGDSPADGVATTVARSDHNHGFPDTNLFRKDVDQTLADGTDVTVGTTTGTKIGTATTQKLGFFDAAPVVQRAAIAAVNASTVDNTYGQEENDVITDLRTKVNSILTALRDLGLIAT